MAQVIASTPAVQSKIFLDSVPTAALAPPSTTHPSTPEIAFLPTSLKAPFSTIRQLFDHLRAHPSSRRKPKCNISTSRRIQDGGDKQPAIRPETDSGSLAFSRRSDSVHIE